MDDEKLIECVKMYPVLYDVRHMKYLDPGYKSMAWSTIAEKLSQSEESCKKRWCNIRDQFKRTLNKRRAKFGENPHYLIKRYKYETNLQFLLSFMSEKDKNFKLEEGNALLTEADSEQADRSEDDSETALFLSNSEQFVEDSTANSEAPGTSFTQQKAKRKPEEDQGSHKLLHNLIKHVVKSKNRKQAHHVDAFLQGLAPTIKTFSPYNQHIAKVKIFEAVRELEYQQLIESKAGPDSQPQTS